VRDSEPSACGSLVGRLEHDEVCMYVKIERH